MNREDRRGGFYWVKDRPYVSVTKCLTAINKPQLLSWAAKETYRAMLVNPGLDEEAATTAFLRSRDKAADRGRLIHSAVEAYKTSGATIVATSPDIKGYIEAFYRWVKDAKVVIEDQEKTVISEKYGYAGTLDLLVRVNGGSESRIVDIKTNKAGAIYPEHHLQQSAYLQALRESGVEVKGGAVLSLMDDGRYAYHEIKEDFDVFLAVKKLFVWQNEDLCKKVGYQG